MKVEGFRFNPIPQFRRLLKVDYPLSSIFKELIQNADDAGARQVHFGWMSDWPQNAHPLLHGPTLFAINDGKFTHEDRKSICSFSESAKGNDIGSIGSFGLGMKSVFNLCEALFYIASPNQEASNGQLLVSLLTPWAQSDRHIDWEKQISADVIENISSFWSNCCERWFCILVPLRTKLQLNGFQPIVNRYKSVDDFFTDKPDLEMVHFLPLLKSLQELTIWDWDSKTRIPKMIRQLRVDTQELKRRRFPKLESGSVEPLRGNVLLSNSSDANETYCTFFSGFETLLDDQIFQEIKKNDLWPTTENSETGLTEPNKGEPHCAVVFSTQKTNENGRGTLQIDQAAFLPFPDLGDPIECVGNRHFRLILHGWYFLDDGRRAVLKRSEQDKGIEEDWNEQIDTLGVFPLVLPALDQFVKDTKLEPDEAEQLTRSLIKSDIIKNNKQLICAKEQWLRRVNDPFFKYGTWEKIGANTKYFVLPTPPVGNLKLPFEVFHNLAKICQEDGNVFVFNNQPRLTSNNPGNWNYDLTRQMIDYLGPDSLTTREGMNYLINFLEESFKKIEDCDLSKLDSILAHSLMRLICKHGLDVVKPHNDLFVKLLETLRNESIVALDLNASSVQKLASCLPDVELTQILLPKDTLPTDFEGGKLRLSRADIILNWLSHGSEIDPKFMSRTALAVIEKTDGNKEEKLQKLGNYELFSLGKLGVEEGQKVSWKTLEKRFAENSLFEKGSRTIPSFVYALRKAVPDQKLYILNRSGSIDPFKLLFNSSAPQLGRDCCVEILNNRPKLANPEERELLLKELVKDVSETSSPDYLKALRYLLHGDPLHFDDTSTYLLFDTNREYDNFCSKLTQEALKRCQGQWFIIDPTLGNEINQNQGARLNVKVITSNLEEALLLEMTDLSWINELEPTEDDCNKILRALENQKLFRRLPIHLNVHGQRISIESNQAYLRNSDCFKTSEKLENLVTVVEAPDNRKAVHDYLKFLDPWTPATAMKEALESKNPAALWKDILDCLWEIYHIQQTQPSDELTGLCKVTSWIPTTYGPKPPNDLIILEGIEDKLRLILDSPSLEGNFICTGQIESKFRAHPSFSILKTFLVPKTG